MNELALFAGAGGGILGGILNGWRTVCAVELNAYKATILAQRQNDGILRPFPIWSDVRTFDPEPWRGIVDVVSAGFPCQDISIAGKGKGLEGKKSGLYFEVPRIVRGIKPRFVWLENSPILTSRGIDRVCRDLASMGYDAIWGVLGAHKAGAYHRRDRIWILAYTDSAWELQPERSKQEFRKWTGNGCKNASDSSEIRCYQRSGQSRTKRWLESEDSNQFTNDHKLNGNNRGFRSSDVFRGFPESPILHGSEHEVSVA